VFMADYFPLLLRYLSINYQSRLVSIEEGEEKRMEDRS